MNILSYKLCIKNGQHEKVQSKNKKLESIKGHDIYVQRSFREKDSPNKTSAIEDLLQQKKTVLLKGEAGAGKSSVLAKLIQSWAESEEAKDISCMLFLAAGSRGKISLQRIVWDGHYDVVNWAEEDFHKAYLSLKNLAIEGKVAVLIDGLDEIGDISTADAANAVQSSANPHLEVDIKTTCAGILAQKMFPGANVLATGRITSLTNEGLLEGQAKLFELEDMTEDNRDTMVGQMEVDTGDRERIQQELQRVATRTTKMFFRTPLMIKNIIQLIIEKSVDIKDLKSSSEVNLMIAMKNLYFHTDQNTSFTELDSPEDQEYLLMCMKLCQQKIQLSDEGDNINTVRGIQSM